MPHHNSPCDNCPAFCCRNYHLVINGYDAFRISSTLKIPVNEFCELRWINESTGEYKILLNGAAGTTRRFHRLVIRKVPDPDPQYEEGRCTFLVTVGDRGRCGIYDVRPGMCGVYPSSFYNGLVTFNEGTAKYCPPDSWQVEAIDVPVFRLRHLRKNRQGILWDGLVDGWNERLLFEASELSDKYFFYFLTNAYRELERREPSLLEPDNDRPPEPVDRLLGLVDQVLRDLEWRTDATVHGRTAPMPAPVSPEAEAAAAAGGESAAT